MTTTLPIKRETRKTKTVSTQEGRAATDTSAASSVTAEPPAILADVPGDGPRMEDELLYEARCKITLRCGKSSITLHPNGKIVLHGEYILSDADGVNRIAGGQIELN